MSQTRAATPARHQLPGPVLAAALAAAGLTPSPRSDLAQMAAVAPDAAALAGSGLLGGDGKLDPQVHAALAVLADPSRAVVVLGNRAGSATCTEALLVARDVQGPWVMSAPAGDGIDMALLPTRAAAVTMLDQLLEISGLPAARPGRGVDLPGSAMAALVAAADTIQEADLRSRLERRSGSAEPALSEEALDEKMARARAAVDTRWACSLAHLIFPADSLKAVKGHHGEGLRALESAGLVTAGAAGHAPTAAGRDLLDPLTRLIGGGSVSTGGLTAGGRIATAHLSVFRAADAVMVAAWTGGGAEARATLARTGTAAALKLLDGVLEHAGDGIDAEGAVS